MLVSVCYGQEDRIQYSSLPDLLTQGSAAFSKGEYSIAANAFNLIRTDYREEPEWLESDLPRKLLPLAGFASQRAGELSDSIAALEAFFESFAEPEDSNEFARYTLASSYLRNDDLEKAANAFKELSENARNDSIAGIALIQLAKLSSPAEGILILESALAKTVATRVSTQTRLALIRLALDSKEYDTARSHLLEHHWDETQMPEFAVLSFLAFEIGDLLAENQPEDAIRAYRMIPAKKTLVQRQKSKLAQLQRIYSDRIKTLTAQQSIWADFYRQIIQSLKGQLESIESNPDFQDALELRKADCLRKLNRPLEAWLLLEELSSSEDAAVAKQAHKNWISTAREIQAWSASALIAQRYIETYPESEDIVEALYWIGQSQLEQKEFEKAANTFKSIATKSIDADLVSTSHYLCGYANFMSGRSTESLASFKRAIDVSPSNKIAGQATLWIGITHFTQNNWQLALDAFEQVQANSNWEPLRPEAAFRIATCQYAADETMLAEQLITDWIQRYPTHERHGEALLLQGDILFLHGHDEKAKSAYLAIDETLRELRFFAINGLSSIYEDAGDFSETIELCEEYSKGTIPREHLGSFFKLWHQALVNAGRDEEANKQLSNAIASHGNEVKVEGITKLISELYKNRNEQLETLATSAAQTNQPTLSARYRLVYSQCLLESGHPYKSEFQRLKLVSDYAAEDLPPSCLAAAGEILLDMESTEYEMYFHRILKSYPTSLYASNANFGLAKISFQNRNASQALAYLERAEGSPNLDPFQSVSLRARILTDLGRSSETIVLYKALLSDRSLSHRQKADTLFELGQSYLADNQLDPAYGSFQRIFTLYQGETDLVGKSYIECANILYQKKNYTDAHAVCTELLKRAELSSEDAYFEAQNLQRTLQSKIEETNLVTNES